jgi:hypothetical protein
MGEGVLCDTETATSVVDAAGDRRWRRGEIGEIGEALSDEELTELALAADPHVPLDPDATRIADYIHLSPGPLPAWYMPAVVVGRASRLRTVVVLAIVAAFLAVTAAGLCATYGQVVLA